LRYTVRRSDQLSSWESIWSSTGNENTEGLVTIEDSGTIASKTSSFLKLDISRSDP
jgi:hypothetical protein